MLEAIRFNRWYVNLDLFAFRLLTQTVVVLVSWSACYTYCTKIRHDYFVKIYIDEARSKW